MSAEMTGTMFCACGALRAGKSRYCSNACRTRASVARRYIVRPVKRTAHTPQVYKQLAAWLAARMD